MVYSEFREKLLSFVFDSPCLEFLADRIGSDNYRGIAPSQHNRYNMSDILIIIEEIYNLVGANDMLIRTTDNSKRAYNLEEERVYSNCVKNIYNRCGKFTQDSLRKNIFVDMERMGFLHRNKEGRSIRSVFLSQKALELLKYKDNPFQRDLIYVDALNLLLKNVTDVLSHYFIVKNDSEEIKKDIYIDIYDFMFFLSFSNCELNGHTYTVDELIEYIDEFHSFSSITREAIKDFILNYCNAKQKGDKTDKRDLHNWKNEAQQVFMLLGQTPYFIENKGKVNMHYLELRTDKGAIFDDIKKLKRSEQQKREYYKQHNITKKLGFELHHIIPLHYATTPMEYYTLDVWENMIYIDGQNHNCLTQTGNKNTKLSFNGNNVILTDITGKLKDLLLKYKEHVEYDVENQTIMLDFNNGIFKPKVQDIV